MKFFLCVTVLNLASNAIAVNTCNEAIVEAFRSQKKQLPQAFLPLIQKREMWAISVTKEDVTYYNIRSLKLRIKEYDSATKSAHSYLTYYRNDKKVQHISVGITEMNATFFETQYDGDYLVYYFRCGFRMTGIYRCLTEASERVNKHKLAIFTNMNNTKANLNVKKLNLCKKKLRKIDPDAEFVDLLYPEDPECIPGENKNKTFYC